MRVLFCTWDMTGHLNPMVPLGWAFRAAGHEVLVACGPGFTPAVTAAGLPALPVGPEFDSFGVLVDQIAARGWRPTPPVDRREPGAETTTRIRRRSLLGLRVAVDAARAQAPDLVAFARTWRPDLVVYEPSGFAGPLVSRLLGIPSVRHLWSVDLTAPVAEFEADLTGELAREFGLAELGIGGTVTLDPCPTRVQVADDRPRQPVRFVPYNGPSSHAAWLRDPPARRRVCVSWGTSLDRFGFADAVLAPRVVDALAGEDVEVVVAVPESQRRLFGALPANVRHLGPTPLHLLLPSCDAIVQQGGAGTTMTALATGVPQLVVAHMPDGVFHGRQIATSGVGRQLPGGDATVEAIKDATLTLLDDPSYRRTAREVRAEMLARPCPRDVVEILERLAARPAST
jgi:UDP:flavonoid glycosyltransferase YjiC (YdhE family)